MYRYIYVDQAVALSYEHVTFQSIVLVLPVSDKRSLDHDARELS
jgi:hypothetical protein